MGWDGRMSRAGRKRLLNRQREPNGRAKRVSATEAQENRSVAVGARQRVYGASPEQAEQMGESTHLGDLKRRGLINATEFEAGTTYRAIVIERHKTIGARGYGNGGDFNAGGGYDAGDGMDDDEVRRYLHAQRRFIVANRALVRSQEADRRAKSITDLVCITDCSPGHLIPPLIVGLNYLARALGGQVDKPSKSVETLSSIQSGERRLEAI